LPKLHIAIQKQQIYFIFQTCFMSKRILLFTCFLFLWVLSFAQTKVVKGKVTDETGSAVPGVSVIPKGARQGTQTDNQGIFTLSVSSSINELLLSSVGYASQTVSIAGKDNITVSLKRGVSTGEEVVVIGYQSVKRKNLLASVSSVSARDIKDIPINSAAEALNGRLAGVTASTSEGSPDAQINVRVRGGMSISQDNSPLYIIDGVQVESGLSAVAPQDIQTIDVLKDAAATAIYGARGANGVIVITTKGGKKGRLIAGYNGFVGVKYLPKTFGVLSPYDFIVYQSERSRGTAADSISFANNYGTTWDTLSNYRNQKAVDWQEEVFGNTGFLTTQNVTAAGGSNKITYNFGYTYNEDKAVVLNSLFRRHLLNFKGDYKIIKNLKFGLSTRYTTQDVFGAGVSSDQGSSYNRLRNAIKYRPFLSIGQNIEDQDQFADPNVANGLNLVNPIALANAEYRKRSTDAINVTANLNYNITKNLTFRTTFGYDNNKIIDREFSDSITPYSIIQGGRLPIADLDTLERTTYTNSNVLTYTIQDFKNKHDFDFLVGQETYDLRTESRNSLFRNFPTFTSYDNAFKNPGLGVLFNGYPRIRKSRYTNVSFFGRVNYSYLDRYLFSFNMRADGASKFSRGKQWGYFPAGSFAWRVSKEKFMKNVDFISDLKFRVGYGEVGNNRINDYLFLTTFSNDGRFYYGLNGQSVNGYYPTSLTNPDLQWESTISRNLGMDISFLKERISLSLDVYDNSSDNLLLNVPIASTYGYQTQLQNIGKTSNKGIELQLNAAIIQKTDFTWNANFNISSNKNKVVALGVNQPFFFPAPSWGVNGQPTDYIVRIGDPVGSMWGLETDGFYTTADFNYAPGAGGYGVYTLKPGVATYGAGLGVVQPGAIKYKDLNRDSIIDFDKDRKIIGNPTPKFSGGLNQQFTFKRWDMSVFVNFSYGNDIYNANKIEFSNGFTPNSNLLDIMQNRWKVVTANGQTAQFINGANQVVGIAPELLGALNANAGIWQPARGTGAAAFTPHSWAIEDGSFLRLNNITIGYSLPKSSIAKLKMSKLRFYITANNLAIITNYSGYDPEVSVRNSPLTPGLDYSAYPKSRSFLFGINASF
jgi:TonB-dependent starch-binding outer membrane protein SusC